METLHLSEADRALLDGAQGEALQFAMQVVVRAATIMGTEPVLVEPRDDESLLDVLRNRCGVISPKDGCQPQGQCGCCLALIDGHREDAGAQ